MRLLVFVSGFLFLTLFSCSSRNEVILEFENVQGLKEGSPVLINGLEIGKVNKFKIGRNNAILVVTELDKLSQIPRDSKFLIVTVAF